MSETKAVVRSRIPRITEEYDYRDADDRLRYQIIRSEPGPNGRGKTYAGPIITLIFVVFTAVLYPAIKAARIRPVEAIQHH